ncbi:PR domain zinc finger protein 14 [Lonchura striata]|uniref:PR domain zinc finger protein 14 n=1 Tax=Lonchura striata TaxID=40157 RepID=A0A218U823_9PASE|nr:PR domain zinc finger protein 14 [Lonchura striata domestica]
MSPAGLASYYPSFLPPAHYFETAPDFFQPLKPLGGLVSTSSPLPPFTFSRVPAFVSEPPPLPTGPFPSLPLPVYTRLPSPFPPSEGSALATGAPKSLSPPHPSPPHRAARSPGADGAAGHSHRYHFTEEELNAVLYGALRGSQPTGNLHAISGLRVSPANSGAADSAAPLLDRDSLQLPEGVRFGPFQGKVVNTSEIKTYDDNSLMWEIFEYGGLSHFIDGKGSTGNWMSLVNCARFPEEQNLTAIQCQGQIFYETCKEIFPNQELLVWYGDCYVQFLGIPISLKGMAEGKKPPQHPEEAGESFKCERCGKVFAYKYYRDKHLKYTRCVDQGDRKFPCHLCDRSFEKRDRLRIHILHVHEKHRPHKAFTASSILRTHIRQHSGEKPFKCKHCGKAFASHAAHDSHVRRTHSKDKGCACSVCGQHFPEQEDCSFHMKIHAAH